MESGKELDLLIAQKIMGGVGFCGFQCPLCGSEYFGTVDISAKRWKRECHGEFCGWTGYPEEALPPFSKSEQHAWQVFKTITVKRGWHGGVLFDPRRLKDNWSCWVSWPTPGDPIIGWGDVEATTDSPALCICLAALKAVEAAGGK